MTGQPGAGYGTIGASCSTSGWASSRDGSFHHGPHGLLETPSLLLFPREPEPQDCTGVAAHWCPNHFGCTCEDRGTLFFRWIIDPECPLHMDKSDHATFDLIYDASS